MTFLGAFWSLTAVVTGLLLHGKELQEDCHFVSHNFFSIFAWLLLKCVPDSTNWVHNDRFFIFLEPVTWDVIWWWNCILFVYMYRALHLCVFAYGSHPSLFPIRDDRGCGVTGAVVLSVTGPSCRSEQDLRSASQIKLPCASLHHVTLV